MKRKKAILIAGLFLLSFGGVPMVASAEGLEATQGVITWNPNAEADLAWYRLYTRQTKDGQPKALLDLTKDATSTLTPKETPPGQNYFTLTAGDTSNNESGHSNLAAFVQLVGTMPRNLQATQITWNSARLTYQQDAGKADFRVMPMPFQWGEAVSVPCVNFICDLTNLIPDTAYGFAAAGYTGEMNTPTVRYVGLTPMVQFRTAKAPIIEVKKQCEDGKDNDGDLLTDFPKDPGCSSATDDDETDPIEPAKALCENGQDDDGDQLVDYPADKGCTDPKDNDETDPIVIPPDLAKLQAELAEQKAAVEALKTTLLNTIADVSGAKQELADRKAKIDAIDALLKSVGGILKP